VGFSVSVGRAAWWNMTRSRRYSQGACWPLVLVLAGAGCSSFRPRPAPKDLAELLEPIRAEHHLPALVAAVVQGDRLIALGAVGRRRADAPDPATVNDRFHLGSCTKAMTATLLAMLVEEGRLSWRQTIGETFPELKDRIRSEFRAVTLAQLVRHRGGLPEDRVPDELFFRIRRELHGPMIGQRLKLTEWALSRPPAAPPGEKMLYSNHGYVIAAAMAERATGKSWEELVGKRLFEPLKMTTAGFGPPGLPGRTDQPLGHERAGDSARPVEIGPEADNPPCYGPAGTVHASPADWGRYLSFYLEGLNGKSRLLKAEAFAALCVPALDAGGLPALAPAQVLADLRAGTLPASPLPEGYAAGWLVSRQPDLGPVLSHAGSNGLWFALARVAPRRDFAVLAATNIGDPAARQACEQAAAALMDLAAKQPP